MSPYVSPIFLLGLKKIDSNCPVSLLRHRAHLQRYTARMQRHRALCRDIWLICRGTGLLAEIHGSFAEIQGSLQRYVANLQRHRAPCRDIWLICRETGLNNSRAQEIRLEIITSAIIWNKFSLSPRNFQTSFHGIPQNFKQVFTGVNGSSRHSKEWTGTFSNLQIQIFESLVSSVCTEEPYD